MSIAIGEVHDMSNLWVVGSVNIDLVSCVAELPKPGETVTGNRTFTTFGGKGANQAVATARLGGHVIFMGCVGKDDNGRQYRDHLEAEGIDLSLLLETADAPTGCAQIILDDHGQNMIVISSGANRMLRPEHLGELRHRLTRDDIVVMQLEIPTDTVMAVMEIAKHVGAKIVLNSAPASGWKNVMLKSVDTLILNEIEMRAITGIRSDDPAAFFDAGKKLIAAGCGAVIVTRGHESTLVVTPQRRFAVATLAVSPVDTVGAGDTFVGAFAVACGEGLPIQDAVILANCAAALATTAHGAQQAMPDRSSVEKHLRERTYQPEAIEHP